jgi:hypothetical protein
MERKLRYHDLCPMSWCSDSEWYGPWGRACVTASATTDPVAVVMFSVVIVVFIPIVDAIVVVVIDVAHFRFCVVSVPLSV